MGSQNEKDQIIWKVSKSHWSWEKEDFEKNWSFGSRKDENNHKIDEIERQKIKRREKEED